MKLKDEIAKIERQSIQIREAGKEIDRAFKELDKLKQEYYGDKCNCVPVAAHSRRTGRIKRHD